MVSIVMPVHNRAAVVPAAIASVQSQTHQDWELLVVDDGSTDGSAEVAGARAAADPRILLLRSDHGGVSRARNLGISRARGRYVAFLDSDNRWRADHLRSALAALEENGWDMAHTVLRAVKDGETYHRALEGTREHLLVANHIDLNVLVVRRDLLDEVDGFDESLRRFVDWDLVLRLTERADPHLVDYLGVEYADDHDDPAGPRISTAEPWAWMAVVASHHLEAAHRCPEPDVPGVTTVVLPEPSVGAVGAWARATLGRPDLGVVVVGSSWPLWRHLAVSALSHAHRSLRFVHLPVARGATVSANVGLSAACGERAVAVLDEVEADADAVVALAEALEDGVAIALPSTRAGGAPGAVSPREVAGPVLAVRTATVRRHGGLDPLLRGVLSEADLALRWHEAGCGRPVRTTQTVVVRASGRRPAAPADRHDAAESLLAERYPQDR